MTTWAAIEDVARSLAGISLNGKPVPVYDYIVRPGDAPRPCICINYITTTLTDHQLQIEAYIGASDGNVREAQVVSMALRDVLDVKIREAGYGATGGTVSDRVYDRELDAWVLQFPILVPHTDY